MLELQSFYTNRLILKKFTPHTYERLFNEFNNDEIKSILGLVSNEEVMKERERHQQGVCNSYKNIVWFQIVNQSSNTIIGYCGYHLWNKQHSRAEIGYYLLHNEYKQKGYMTEALEFVINYGFTEMCLNRIEAFVEPNNLASIKSLEKFNFEKEGYCRQHYFYNGNFDDSVFYALLKANYNICKKESSC